MKKISFSKNDSTFDFKRYDPIKSHDLERSPRIGIRELVINIDSQEEGKKHHV